MYGSFLICTPTASSWVSPDDPQIKTEPSGPVSSILCPQVLIHYKDIQISNHSNNVGFYYRKLLSIACFVRTTRERDYRIFLIQAFQSSGHICKRARMNIT